VEGAASEDKDMRARHELMTTGGVSLTGRGQTAAVGDLSLLWGLAGLMELLSLRRDDKVSFYKTARIVARLECGYQRQMQFVRATENFMKRPWFCLLKYYTGSGQEEGSGRERLILRAVGMQRTCCAVIQRMRIVPARPNCVLSKFNCVRLAWAFDRPSDGWPALDVVDGTKIVRLEYMQPDWYHIGDKYGLDAMPEKLEKTAAGRHDARFSTNSFYPWISRKLSPGLCLLWLGLLCGRRVCVVVSGHDVPGRGVAIVRRGACALVLSGCQASGRCS